MTFGYRFSHYFYLDNEMTFFSGSGSYAKKGSAKDGLFAYGLATNFASGGLFGSIRPGFVHYSKALLPESATQYESTTRFAFDFGAIVEYAASPPFLTPFQCRNDSHSLPHGTLPDLPRKRIGW